MTLDAVSNLRTSNLIPDVPQQRPQHRHSQEDKTFVKRSSVLRRVSDANNEQKIDFLTRVSKILSTSKNLDKASVMVFSKYDSDHSNHLDSEELALFVSALLKFVDTTEKDPHAFLDYVCKRFNRDETGLHINQHEFPQFYKECLMHCLEVRAFQNNLIFILYSYKLAFWN